jgi:hypothetical protein
MLLFFSDPQVGQLHDFPHLLLRMFPELLLNLFCLPSLISRGCSRLT